MGDADGAWCAFIGRTTDGGLSRQVGKSVAVVERKLLGGTSVGVGCTPTETLVASAYAAHLAGGAADYGVSADVVVVNFAAVVPRTKRSRL
jgi:pyruvate/2-oxoglutarate dehydrogenase complex dihydrolipoamide dehydrogenase (E3) component